MVVDSGCRDGNIFSYLLDNYFTRLRIVRVLNRRWSHRDILRQAVIRSGLQRELESFVLFYRYAFHDVLISGQVRQLTGDRKAIRLRIGIDK